MTSSWNVVKWTHSLFLLLIQALVQTFLETVSNCSSLFRRRCAKTCKHAPSSWSNKFSVSSVINLSIKPKEAFTIFFIMELLINFKGIVFMLNKYYSRQNLRLFEKKNVFRNWFKYGTPPVFSSDYNNKNFVTIAWKNRPASSKLKVSQKIHGNVIIWYMLTTETLEGYIFIKSVSNYYNPLKKTLSNNFISYLNNYLMHLHPLQTYRYVRTS